MVIKRTSSGFQVRSESGKNLSKPNLTLGQAKRRLEQVDYFKAKDAGADAGPSRAARGGKKRH